MSILYRIRWGRVLLAGAAIFGLTTLFTGEPPMDADVTALKPGDDLALLANRPWMDRMPRNERDMVTQVLFLDKDSKKVGAMMRASKWRQLVEGLRWSPRSGGLTIELPQLDKSIPVRASAKACKDAPKPFDLCLDVSLLGKGVRLYSKKAWTASSVEEAQALLVVTPDAEGEPAILYELLTDPETR